ncbi:hypothetical protein M9H77_26679 [Catharanthus roseus]|uniref:Uncharacterized protein n=1 Tax=Catharanthus roseus TaxID=4058 RepID=A0ACC0AEF3_CATRO|nr:hypothetical protein M9H77_26679 [Catharanthus roseus]
MKTKAVGKATAPTVDERQPTIDGRCREWPGCCNLRPTADGRPHITISGGERRDFFLRKFFIKEVNLGKCWIQICHQVEDSSIRQPPNEGYNVNGWSLPTQSHQEGTSDLTRMNLNETLRSMQQSIERLARQFQGIARDVKELKKKAMEVPQ